MKIGKKIRDLRNKYNLTQEELANRLELSKGYISQLENDLTEPSVSTLEDIVLALGTNLSDFFASDQTSNQIVFKKDDYFVKENPGYNITWLITNAQKNEMEPILVTISANCATDLDYPHEGQEFGYILEGEILLVIGNQTHKVKKGEAFYIDCDQNHYIKNVKDKPCKLIWVSSPPNF